MWRFTELELQSAVCSVLAGFFKGRYCLLRRPSLSPFFVSQAEDVVKKKPRATAEVSGRKCQQTLAELESVLSHLEGLLARTLVLEC